MRKTYEYFTWLVNKVDGEKSGRMELLHTLFLKPFYGYFKNDANRAEDGIELREEYYYETGEHALYDWDSYAEQCSILEMIIALAIRCDAEITYDFEEAKPGVMFWKMIDNLGLIDVTDSNYDETYVNYVIEKFLTRKYDKDGYGSLFYIPGTDKDMRGLEIWYQMQEYLIECWD